MACYTLTVRNLLGLAILLTMGGLASTPGSRVAERFPVRPRPVNACSVTGGNTVSIQDVEFVYDVMMGVLPYSTAADVNHDGKVDMNDYLIVLRAFLGGGCDTGIVYQ